MFVDSIFARRLRHMRQIKDPFLREKDFGGKNMMTLFRNAELMGIIYPSDPHSTPYKYAWPSGDINILAGTSMDEKVFPCPGGAYTMLSEGFYKHKPIRVRPDDLMYLLVSQMGFYFKNVDRDAVHITLDPTTCTPEDVEGQLTKALLEGTPHYSNDPIERAALVKWVCTRFTTTTTTDIICRLAAIFPGLRRDVGVSLHLRGEKEKGKGVTLGGSVDDWRLLSGVAGEIARFDNGDMKMVFWAQMLRPIFDEFITRARGGRLTPFWDDLAHTSINNLAFSGWLSAFSVFRANGEWQGGDVTTPPDPDTGHVEWPTAQFAIDSICALRVTPSSGKGKSMHLFSGHVGVANKGSLQGGWCIASDPTLPHDHVVPHEPHDVFEQEVILLQGLQMPRNHIVTKRDEHGVLK